MKIIVDGDLTITTKTGEIIRGKKFNNKYVATENGRVFTFRANHHKWVEQKGREQSHGYVRMSIDGRDAYLHRIVATCYVQNPHGYPEVNHINGNKKDNTANNLEWCTRAQNNKHAFETGLRSYKELSIMANSPKNLEKAKKRRKITFNQAEEIRAITGATDTEIALKYGISRATVYYIRKGKIYKNA